MTNYGQIKSYDSGKGHGTIAPEKGGEVLDFRKADLQQEAAEPKSGQRFGYETKKVAGNKDCATNLRQQEQGEGHGKQDDQRKQASKQQG